MIHSLGYGPTRGDVIKDAIPLNRLYQFCSKCFNLNIMDSMLQCYNGLCNVTKNKNNKHVLRKRNNCQKTQVKLHSRYWKVDFYEIRLTRRSCLWCTKQVFTLFLRQKYLFRDTTVYGWFHFLTRHFVCG